MIPLTKSADLLRYTGEQRNSRGNVVDTWAEPVPVRSNWYVSSSHEPQIAGHERVLVDAQWFVPQGTEVGTQDKVRLPGYAGDFEVIGEVESYNDGPFSSGWPLVVNLRRVTG